MAAASVSVFLRFLFHRLRLFLRSLPSAPRGNRRDIFLDPISTTCCRRVLLPYRVPVFPVRVSLEYGACSHPPIPRRNALARERARCFPLLLRRDIGVF